MYAYFKGTLVDCSTTYIILEIQNVGYKIFIPRNFQSELKPALQKEIFVHTSFIVREDIQILYGFPTKEMRDLFEKLITISGVGPKIAINLLGHFDLDTLIHSIQQGDFRLISKIPGIGKKTAERIIIEIRDKIGNATQSSNNPFLSDAIHALIHLGYAPLRAQKAISSVYDQKIHQNLSLLISDALKKI